MKNLLSMIGFVAFLSLLPLGGWIENDGGLPALLTAAAVILVLAVTVYAANRTKK